MNYLVTGGAGFIGSNIVRELVSRGDAVRILDDLSTGNLEHLEGIADTIEFMRGDIRSESDLARAMQGIDYCIHQAALRSVPRSVDDPISSNEVNITGTLKVLMAARTAKVRRVVYASSSSVYGDCPCSPQKEEYRNQPISPYAVSKLGGELYCMVYAKTFGLEAVALRYFNVFGERQDPESKYSAVIPLFIQSAFENKPLIIHGDGDQSRDFTYIANVVQANLLAATTPGVSGEVFNIACNRSLSVNDIADTLEKILGRRLERQHTAARAGDVRKTHADISRACALLGYAPMDDFELGLRRTVEYFKGKGGSR